jgi:pimeloyl-ACP methyl ester carboxylesterase
LSASEGALERIGRIDRYSETLAKAKKKPRSKMLVLERGAHLIDAATTHIVQGVPLEMVVKGAGRPLLFLHGMDGMEAASALIDSLAAHFTVYAPSHPGFGASHLPDHIGTTDDLAYFYLDLLDLLQLDDLCLVAMSFGGWIAAEILVKNQSRIRNVVLGAPLGLRTGQRRRQVVSDLFMMTPQVAETMQYADPALAQDPAGLPDRELHRRLRNREAMALFGWAPYLNNPKLGGRLHRITRPTLLVWGADDALLPASYRSAFEAALPHAQVATISECGHRLYAERPQEIAELAVAFAARAVEELQ